MSVVVTRDPGRVEVLRPSYSVQMVAQGPQGPPGPPGEGGWTPADTDPLYVNVTGDTMTGTDPYLTVSGTNSASLILDSPTAANTDRAFRFRTNGQERWSFGAEPDASSMFSISAFDDGGGWVGNAMEIRRSDQLVKLAGDPTAPLHAATKQYTDARTPPIIVLGPTDPVPGGTPAGTIIIRTA